MDERFEALRASVAAVYARHEPARFAAEVRWVARLESFARIRAYLLGVEQWRGFDSARELREAVWALMQAGE